MADKTYDAVIVGGRCAGATLAAYMARDGASVIVLEADKLGSDQVLSTHTIHPPGMDILDELGVGDDVRQGSPPAQKVRLQFEDAIADITPQEGRHEVCPRRYRLDRLVQEAAAAAGAEVCEHTRVTDLIRDSDRVGGVRAERGGQAIELRGRLVVGADGRNSTVARLVAAEEYLGFDWQRGMYWAYWEPSAAWHSEDYPYDFLLRFVGDDRRIIFQTDDGQLLIGTLPHLEVARGWRSDHEERYLEDLRSDPVLEPLVSGGKRVSKVVGTVSERFFFRQSVGPGWALVGDAGHHKDPIVGWGIGEALVQAKHLAAAALDGSEVAFQRYWRQRDVDALARFRLAEDRGAPGRLNPVFAAFMPRVATTTGLPEKLFRETEWDANPYELLPASTLARWTLGAAVRGRPGLILDFLRQGRRVSAVRAELKERRKLLEAVGAA